MKCEIGIEWMVSWSTQCGRPLPLNRRAGMRVCTMVCLHWGVWWDQGSPMVCCLWLMEMSGTCGCFHDSAIHMCVPLYRSPQSTHHMPAFCRRSIFWGHEDLMTIHHTLVCCLVIIPSHQMPFQPLFSAPRASSTTIFLPCPLAFHIYLESIF